MNAAGIGSARLGAAPAEAGAAGGRGASQSRVDFLERLRDAFAGADADQKRAEHEVRELGAGRGSTVETMLALSKAELSLRFVIELRNRALEAYREMSRLQL